MDMFKHHIKIVVLIGEVCPHFIRLDSTVSSGLTEGLDNSVFPVKQICLSNTNFWQAVRAIKSLGQGVAYALSLE